MNLSPRDETAGELHLEEAVLGVAVADRRPRVELRLRHHVRDAEVVAAHRHGLREAGQAHLSVHLG